MICVVTDFEWLYYQYKLSKISSCTKQVHGLLHLSMAMRVCAPNHIHHQYTMERTVGTIKAMCHSRSSPNRNLSLQMLERERFQYLPLIAIVSTTSLMMSPAFVQACLVLPLPVSSCDIVHETRTYPLACHTALADVFSFLKGSLRF